MAIQLIGSTSNVSITGTPKVRIATPNDPTSAPSNETTTAYEASHVIKATPGVLFGCSGYNAKTAAQFIMFYDAAALPANGAQAVVVISVPASSNFSVDFGVYGRRFSTGIVWSNSSTAPTKTIGSGDCFLDAQYA